MPGCCGRLVRGAGPATLEPKRTENVLVPPAASWTTPGSRALSLQTAAAGAGIDPSHIDVGLGLGAAVLAGGMIGINRDLADRPIGTRALGLSLPAAAGSRSRTTAHVNSIW